MATSEEGSIELRATVAQLLSATMGAKNTNDVQHFPDPTYLPKAKADPASTIPCFDDPPGGGIDVAVAVQQTLAKAGILSCVVDTAALVYYGGPFVINDIRLCVPTALLDSAARLVLESHSSELHQVDVSEASLRHDKRCAFPIMNESRHFQYGTYNFFLRLCPSWVVSLDSVFDKPGRGIVHNPKSGLNYPALRDFVQSALDSCQLENLENIIDSMNLTDEWADKVGIDFDKVGPTAAALGRPYSRREVWDYNIRNKLKRVGLKNDPKLYATCFRLHGDGDMTLKIKCEGDFDENGPVP